MSDERQTAETVCKGCENKPCDKPCERWYELLEKQLTDTEGEGK